MRSILDQLVSDQAMLLMYMAGELPSMDQAAVEQRLKSDEAFRSQLESLQASRQQIGQMLDGLDALQVVPGSAASSQRAISRMMKQWQAERLLQAGRSQSTAPARSKWVWIGPVAAAAVLLIGWGVWWGMQPDKYSPIPTTPADATPAAVASSAAADDSPADVVADSPGDPDLSLGDAKAYAAMNAEYDYVQALSDLTTLR